MKVSCHGKVSDLEIGQEVMVPASKTHTVTNYGKTVSRIGWVHYPNFA